MSALRIGSQGHEVVGTLRKFSFDLNFALE